MLRMLRRLHRRTGHPHWLDLPVPAALWAVGDLHGRADLMARMEQRIRAETPSATVVYLGDLIDRGPDSRAVIERMLAPAEGLTRLALLGNHEDMALRFLDHPEAADRWLDHGGTEALVSWGVTPAPGEGAAALCRRFEAALPAAQRDFLATLPLGLTIGRHVLTHAGAAAELPLSAQGKSELVWQRHGEIADLLPPADLGARIVVHGHVPGRAIRAAGWRINLDTNAWKSGRLSAARLYQDRDPDFVTVAAGPSDAAADAPGRP